MRNNHPLITLITDFGTRDGFVGIMKGVIRGIAPTAAIVDISHEVPPQDISAAGFILNNAYPYFAPGTVHTIVVDPGVGSERSIILAKANNQFFLAPDNGVLAYVIHHFHIQKVINVTCAKYFRPEISNTFHGRDIFAPIAAHLAGGTHPEELGEFTTNFNHGQIPQLLFEENTVLGKIVYIDVFGNLITNISHQVVPSNISKKKLQIKFKNTLIEEIQTSYKNGNPGQMLAIWGSSGNLELAIKNKRAADETAEIGDYVQLSWQEV
ncbi:SAM-dependent chlorinase/fluorinase [bacterium]|nr:SAM-dependent chlorinase/fluorinase [bacterium]